MQRLKIRSRQRHCDSFTYLKYLCTHLSCRAPLSTQLHRDCLSVLSKDSYPDCVHEHSQGTQTLLLDRVEQNHVPDNKKKNYSDQI